MRPALAVAALLGLIVVTVPGCTSPYEDPRLSYLAVPPDFSVELHVEGDPAADDPLRQASHFVVQPNRRLHVATGRGASVRTFPPVLRVLTPEEYESLYRIVRRGALMEPTAEGAPPAAAGSAPATAPAAVYEASLTAGGVTRRYTATPESSPATAALLQRLEELRATLGPVSR